MNEPRPPSIRLPPEQWENKRGRPEYLHHCTECNSRFIAQASALVCSDRCEKRRARRRKPRPVNTCRVCGQPFEATRKTQAVCPTTRCRERHYRRDSRFRRKEND